MSKLERVTELVDRATYELYSIEYGTPETVGTALVRKIDHWDSRPGRDIVFLKFPGADENGLGQIVMTSIEWVKEGEVVEVIVRGGNAFFTRFNPYLTKVDEWMVAIRPFSPETYGKPVGSEDGEIRQMFRENEMLEYVSSDFHQRFLKNK